MDGGEDEMREGDGGVGYEGEEGYGLTRGGVMSLVVDDESRSRERGGRRGERRHCDAVGWAFASPTSATTIRFLPNRSPRPVRAVNLSFHHRRRLDSIDGQDRRSRIAASRHHNTLSGRITASGAFTQDVRR